MAQSFALPLLIVLVLSLVAALPVRADTSPFDFAESHIEASPNTANMLRLNSDETVVDFDVSPVKPEAALIIKTTSGKQKMADSTAKCITQPA